MEIIIISLRATLKLKSILLSYVKIGPDFDAIHCFVVMQYATFYCLYIINFDPAIGFK